MGLKPGASNVLHTATIIVGTTGCLLLCFRVARLLAAGLALGLGKRCKAAENQPPESNKLM